MLVSIIVPVYNVERYLRQCLDSLRNQTLSDIEVICVDDGSTDGSLDILREYEKVDARFRVITKPNAGYGHTMNCGFTAARAPYVGILESDDFCAPQMCEVLYRLALDNNLDIVRTDIDLYWEQSGGSTQRAHYVFGEGLNEVFDPRDRRECFWLPPALCCMLVRKSIIDKNKLRFLETPGASYQDTAFSFKLWACAKRTMVVAEAFVFYRQDNEASSINQVDKLYCVSVEYGELERFLLEECNRGRDLVPIMEKRKFSAYLWNYERIAPEYHSEFAQYASREFQGACNRSVLIQELYSSEEWDDLMLLIDDPLRFIARMDKWSQSKVRRFHVLSRIARKLRRC